MVVETQKPSYTLVSFVHFMSFAPYISFAPNEPPGKTFTARTGGNKGGRVKGNKVKRGEGVRRDGASVGG